MSGPFSLPRKCEPPADGHPECVVFKWIGQSFASCDQCGRPSSEHLYDPPYGGKRPLFHVKERDYCGWIWSPVGSFVRHARAVAS